MTKEKRGHEWTDKQSESAKKPNYSKLYVAQPALLELMGELEGKSVVELGSGSGYWSQLLIDKGAREYWGVEISESQMEIAKRENSDNKIKYILADVTEQTPLPARHFDIVLVEHVVLEISEEERLRGLFKEAYRILKEGGLLVFSDIHPFAPYTELPNIKKSKNYDYFDSGHPFNVVSVKPDGSTVSYTDFHWTLSDIWEAISMAGFKIEKIVEPDPSKEVVEKHPYLKYRKGKPMSFMVKASK